MPKIKIVTDSSCTMEVSEREKLGIHIVPLSVMIDNVVMSDDDSLSGEAFMQLMYKAKSLPKTSQPAIGVFADLYDKLAEDGSEIISIHMSEALSGTVSAARQAAQLCKASVTVIDSEFTDQSLSFQVIQAAQLALEGASKAEILDAVEAVKRQSQLFIGVSSLDNLVKGGRVSRVVGVLSNLFNVKVVMEFVNNELVIQAKGRGMKTFNKWFDELKIEIQKLQNVHPIKKIGISHADGAELANYFKEALQALYPEMHIPVLHTNPIIATHTGKGAFAIMFYTE